MIIKVLFTDQEGEEHVMLFGDSYKKWQQQYLEYLRLYPQLEAIGAWVSNSAWKGWGGLKWCSEEKFQEELNREDVQEGEPDTANPRQYSEMHFSRVEVFSMPQREHAYA